MKSSRLPIQCGCIFDIALRRLKKVLQTRGFSASKRNIIRGRAFSFSFGLSILQEIALGFIGTLL